MVGYDKDSSLLTKTDFAIAGAGSGMITRVICQPFDVLKIRFQLQVEPLSAAAGKYTSFSQAVAVIVREEGIKSLWKGHIAGQLLSIFYGIGQFVSFEMYTREAARYNIDPRASPAVYFGCGVLSGATATICSFPFDFVRTRMVAQSEKQKAYASTWKAFIKTYTIEGPFALYKGLWPTVLQIAPQAGVQFMCFKVFNKAYKDLTVSEESTAVGSLISGGLAGLIAKTVVYPLDVVKKRLQIQGFEDNRKMFGRVFKCRGLQDCMVRTYKVEGITGFFKGMYPSVMKAILATALHFSMYEMICKELEKMHRMKKGHGNNH